MPAQQHTLRYNVETNEGADLQARVRLIQERIRDLVVTYFKARPQALSLELDKLEYVMNLEVAVGHVDFNQFDITIRYDSTNPDANEAERTWSAMNGRLYKAFPFGFHIGHVNAPRHTLAEWKALGYFPDFPDET